MSQNVDMASAQQEMLAINAEQTSYYQQNLSGRVAGFLNRPMWRLRFAMYSLQEKMGKGNTVPDLQLRWLGDVSDKRVLELGCLEGSPLTMTLAARAKSYLGIDLSKPAVDGLKRGLQARNLLHADARAVDFLSPEFTDRDFDIVYAAAVIHHFKHLEAFLQTLADKLTPRGLVVTIDPLQASLPQRLVRGLHRYFQQDRDWEWPFTRQTFEVIQNYFEIVAIQGFLGHAKWALPLALLSTNWAVKAGRRLHARDMREACRLGRGLWRCMQVAMCWRKR